MYSAMNHSAALLTLCLLLAPDLAAAADYAPAQPNWSRTNATETLSEFETRETLGSLYQLARERRGDELLLQVQAIADDPNIPDPARDRILQNLALALGEFEPGVIGPEVLEYLAQTKSRTLVPNEEHPEMGVPLFNIRAAATGSLAAWARIESRTYAEASKTFVDPEMFILSLSGGGGAEIAGRIRDARLQFDPAGIEAIVLATPRMADAGTASLVLAELAPEIINRPDAADLLFELLSHRELGATAALVLARNGDESVLLRLAELAAGNAGLAAKRAGLALDAVIATGNDW